MCFDGDWARTSPRGGDANDTQQETVMYVTAQDPTTPAEIPGISHATWASADTGVRLSVWRQSIAPGAATPPHVHDCDEVVMCLAGRGAAHIDGEVHPFGPRETVSLPRNKPHQLFNVGDAPLEVIAAFGDSPVRTHWPDGSELQVPWRT